MQRYAGSARQLLPPIESQVSQVMSSHRPISPRVGYFWVFFEYRQVNEKSHFVAPRCGDKGAPELSPGSDIICHPSAPAPRRHSDTRAGTQPLRLHLITAALNHIFHYLKDTDIHVKYIEAKLYHRQFIVDGSNREEPQIEMLQCTLFTYRRRDSHRPQTIRTSSLTTPLTSTNIDYEPQA